MKSIKKSQIPASIYVIFVILIAGYIIFETYHIFGLLRLVLSSLLTVLGLQYFIRKFEFNFNQQDPKITFKMSEWPKIVSLILSCVGVIVLFSQVFAQRKNIDDYHYVLSNLYIAILMFSPIGFILYELFRDINDFVYIDSHVLRYRDNEIYREFMLNELKEAEIDEKGGLLLVFKNGDNHHIPTYQMNLSINDTSKLIIRLNKEVSKFL
jgi:hypothetical protein